MKRQKTEGWKEQIDEREKGRRAKEQDGKDRMEGSEEERIKEQREEDKEKEGWRDNED